MGQITAVKENTIAKAEIATLRAKFEKRTNYREKYPDLSDEMIEVMQQSDRKMEYQHMT